MQRRFAPLMIRLAALGAALAVVLPASTAWAAAPMCHPSAMTVEAPIPMKPAKDATLTALDDCFLFGAADDRASDAHEKATGELRSATPEPVAEVGSAWLTRRAALTTPIPPAARAPALRARCSRVYRPPRS